MNLTTFLNNWCDPEIIPRHLHVKCHPSDKFSRAREHQQQLLDRWADKQREIAREMSR